MQLQRKRKAMKTKLFLIATLILLIVVLSSFNTKNEQPVKKITSVENTDLKAEFNRLDMLAEKTEKALIYKAN
jgi:hypothetical protein